MDLGPCYKTALKLSSVIFLAFSSLIVSDYGVQTHREFAAWLALVPSTDLASVAVSSPLINSEANTVHVPSYLFFLFWERNPLADHCLSFMVHLKKEGVDNHKYSTYYRSIPTESFGRMVYYVLVGLY